MKKENDIDKLLKYYNIETYKNEKEGIYIKEDNKIRRLSEDELLELLKIKK